jgi:hypothetical protein
MAELTRRQLLAGSTTILAAAALPIGAFTHGGESGNSGFQNQTKGEHSMATLTTKMARSSGGSPHIGVYHAPPSSESMGFTESRDQRR